MGDCSLPFIRTCTVAEERLKRQKEAAQKKAEYEEKKAKWEAQQAEAAKAREARQAEHSVRRPSKKLSKAANPAQEWDTISNSSWETASTMATTFSNEDVRCLASKDKEVRKLEKLLREILKLEECQDLDVLQKKKVARKPQVELELATAQGLAEARARNELRQQNAETQFSYFSSNALSMQSLD